MKVRGLNKRYRIFSIDPGTNEMGFAIIDVDLVTLKPYLIFTDTISGKVFLKSNKTVCETHNDSTAKLCGYHDRLLSEFKKWNPHVVASESPFMGRFPTPFARLSECLFIVRYALIHYSTKVPFFKVDPPSAKLAVGVSPAGSTKEDIDEAVRIIPEMNYPNPEVFDKVTEHETDAIAVGFWMYKYLIGEEVKFVRKKKRKRRKKGTPPRPIQEPTKVVTNNIKSIKAMNFGDGKYINDKS